MTVFFFLLRMEGGGYHGHTQSSLFRWQRGSAIFPALFPLLKWTVTSNIKTCRQGGKGKRAQFFSVLIVGLLSNSTDWLIRPRQTYLFAILNLVKSLVTPWNRCLCEVGGGGGVSKRRQGKKKRKIKWIGVSIVESKIFMKVWKKQLRKPHSWWSQFQSVVVSIIHHL